MFSPYTPYPFYLSVFSAGFKLLIFGGLIALIIYLITKHKKMEHQEKQDGNVLPGPTGASAMPSKKKQKFAALSIFMAVILFGILVMLGERMIFDLNRFLNPVIDKDYTSWANYQTSTGRRSFDIDGPKMPLRSYEMAQDATNAISPRTQIYFNAEEKGRYLMYKLIIHAAVIIPVFIFAFVLFYLKRKNLNMKPLLISFLFAAFWLMFHLLGETINFVMNQYRNIAIYIILVILAAVFGVLAYYTQIKQHKKEDNA